MSWRRWTGIWAVLEWLHSAAQRFDATGAEESWDLSGGKSADSVAAGNGAGSGGARVHADLGAAVEGVEWRWAGRDGSADPEFGGVCEDVAGSFDGGGEVRIEGQTEVVEI